MNLFCSLIFGHHFLSPADNKARAHCKSDDCLKGLKLLKIAKVPCNDFLMMGIRYQHIDPPSPDIDYIAIRLDLTDTRSRSIIQVYFLKLKHFLITAFLLYIINTSSAHLPFSRSRPGSR